MVNPLYKLVAFHSVCAVSSAAVIAPQGKKINGILFGSMATLGSLWGGSYVLRKRISMATFSVMILKHVGIQEPLTKELNGLNLPLVINTLIKKYPPLQDMFRKMNGLTPHNLGYKTLIPIGCIIGASLGYFISWFTSKEEDRLTLSEYAWQLTPSAVIYTAILILFPDKASKYV